MPSGVLSRMQRRPVWTVRSSRTGHRQTVLPQLQRPVCATKQSLPRCRWYASLRILSVYSAFTPVSIYYSYCYYRRFLRNHIRPSLLPELSRTPPRPILEATSRRPDCTRPISPKHDGQQLLDDATLREPESARRTEARCGSGIRAEDLWIQGQ